MEPIDLMNAESLVVRHILGLVLEQVQIAEQPQEFEESLNRAMAIDPQFAPWSDERKQEFVDRAMLHYRVITTPSNFPMRDLSDREQEVLMAAWSGDDSVRGSIIFSSVIGGAYLIAGGEQINFYHDNRLGAEYREAVTNLCRFGLVEYSPNNGYWLTAAGYRVGDILAAQAD